MRGGGGGGESTTSHGLELCSQDLEDSQGLELYPRESV